MVVVYIRRIMKRAEYGGNSMKAEELFSLPLLPFG